ncbi:hypothetical protein ACRAVF_19055 [Bradyrhizobium oligotrophicum S58]
MLKHAEKAFHEYQLKSDNIDKQYANLERLANTQRDREMQLFWANIQTLGPSVYSRPPVPVVVPRFKQRDELARTASEILERGTIVTFEREEVDGEMKLIRDDLVILSRGAAWLRYDTTGKVERVCVDHADRKDFLHDPARRWKDVDWVAKRSWLTEDAAKKRFEKDSGEAYKSLQYAIHKDKNDTDSDDNTKKAGIWEIWCKSLNKVVWVSEGCDVVLDQGPPHLTLEGFFPCPRPAYSTLQRRSLIPVPDYVFYKDQIEEINEITARIAALTEALRVRGFYPSGMGEISDAIEAAFKQTSNNQVMVPIANLQGLSGQSLKDAIAWLPIDVISATVTALIAIRKELINDVYEITGISDIMRGQTEASETLGAQQLKGQYGSVRTKDKQNELIRLARDITRIASEIMAENFSGKTLMEMAQMPLPSDAEIKKQAAPLAAQLQQIQQKLPIAQQQLQALQAQAAAAQQDPHVQQLAQAEPEQAKQIVGAAQQHLQQLQAQVQQMQQQAPQLQAQLQALAATVTIDKVMGLLNEQRLRPFALDIETDSTIAPDENASKQRATEFVTAVGGYMKNALPLVQTMPKASAVVAETLKFVSDQFRAGRSLQGVIEKFADDMEAAAKQPPPPNPEAIKAQADAEAQKAKMAQDERASQADAASKQAQAQRDAADAQAATLEAQTKTKDADAKRQIEMQREQDAAEARKAELAIAQLEAETAARDAEVKRQIDQEAAADAAAQRAVDMQHKAELAALQIQQAREKHAQELETARVKLEMEAEKHAHALEQATRAADLAERNAAEKKAAAAQKGTE